MFNHFKFGVFNIGMRVQAGSHTALGVTVAGRIVSMLSNVSSFHMVSAFYVDCSGISHHCYLVHERRALGRKDRVP